MDLFACLIDSWLWFVYFSFTSKETRQNPATAPINVKIIHSFWVLRGFVIRENRKNLIIYWEKNVCNSLELKWLKARVSSLICKNKFFEHNWVFSTHMASKFGSFCQLWKPNQENFYQHGKLNLNAVPMHTISSEDIEKRHGVARELWSWNSAYSITFWPCHQIQLERMSIFILFWDMMP